MKVGRRGNRLILAAEWIDNQAILYITEMRNRNKAWKYARKKNAPQEIQEALKKRYIEQQIMTSRYLGMEKGEWENKNIL